jgi:hypothetical protein
MEINKYISDIFENVKDKKDKKEYYKLCEKLLRKTINNLKDIKSEFLDKKDYYKICFDVLNNKGSFLCDVNLDVFTKEEILELYKKAISNDGTSLKYVKREYISSSKYFVLCIEAIMQNTRSLENVDVEYLSESEYNYLIKIAIEKNPTALIYVNDKYINRDFEDKNELNNVDKTEEQLSNENDLVTKEEYYNRCLFAENHSVLVYKSMMYVTEGKDLKETFTKEEYFQLCKEAIELIPSVLSYVIKDKITKEEYFQLCLIAINNKPLYLMQVDENKLEKNQYFEIAERAISKDKKAFKFASFDFKKEYNNIFFNFMENKEEKLSFKDWLFLNKDDILKEYEQLKGKELFEKEREILINGSKSEKDIVYKDFKVFQKKLYNEYILKPINEPIEEKTNNQQPQQTQTKHNFKKM